MFDDQDQELGPVLTLVIGIAIAMSLFAIAVALSVAGVFSNPSSRTGATRAGVATSAAATHAIRLYFDVGSAALPGDAAGSLLPLAAAARADGARRIDVAGFHDATGDRATNAELAKDRALAIKAMLMQAGVPDDRVVLRKPVEVEGSGDAREARRVEVGLR